jgi:hypothetical protein
VDDEELGRRTRLAGKGSMNEFGRYKFSYEASRVRNECGSSLCLSFPCARSAFLLEMMLRNPFLVILDIALGDDRFLLLLRFGALFLWQHGFDPTFISRNSTKSNGRGISGG